MPMRGFVIIADVLSREALFHSSVMKRSIKWIGILIVGVVLVSLALYCCRSKEPSYHGKTLTEWLRNREVELTDNIGHDESAKAIKAIGTNALPTLLRMAAASDGALKRLLIRLANGQTIVRVHAQTATEQRDLADMGFAVLGTNALPAVPELIELTKNQDPAVRLDALGFLSLIHPDTNVFFPVLKVCLQDRDVNVQHAAATTIMYGYPHEAERLGVYQVFPDWKKTKEKAGDTTAH